MRDGVAIETTTANYWCRSCGLAQLATVRSLGYGAGAWGAAAANAREDAKRAMSMLLALAKCPRCAHRDEGVVMSNRRARTTAIVATAAIFALFSAGLVALSVAERGLWWVAAIGILVMAVSWWSLRVTMLARYPLEVTDQVTFSDPPQTTFTPVDVGTQTASDGGWKWM